MAFLGIIMTTVHCSNTWYFWQWSVTGGEEQQMVSSVNIHPSVFKWAQVSFSDWLSWVTCSDSVSNGSVLLIQPMTGVWGEATHLAQLYHNFTTLLSGEKKRFSSGFNWTSASKVCIREGLVQGFSLAHKNTESHTERAMYNISAGPRLVSLQA